MPQPIDEIEDIVVRSKLRPVVVLSANWDHLIPDIDVGRTDQTVRVLPVYEMTELTRDLARNEGSRYLEFPPDPRPGKTLFTLGSVGDFKRVTVLPLAIFRSGVAFAGQRPSDIKVVAVMNQWLLTEMLIQHARYVVDASVAWTVFQDRIKQRRVRTSPSP